MDKSKQEAMNERNERMREEFRRGRPVKEIAESYGLSLSVAHSIINGRVGTVKRYSNMKDYKRWSAARVLLRNGLSVTEAAELLTMDEIIVAGIQSLLEEEVSDGSNTTG